MKKSQVQYLVIGGLLFAWVAAGIIASLDGSTMLRATTPVVTLAFGWLFARSVA